MSAVVYKDILIKVAFIGMPSREQSRLVSRIAKNLHTTFVEDNTLGLLSIRQKKNKKLLLHIPDFYDIANKKYKMANAENKIFSGREYLIYNSTGFVDHLLSIATHNRFDENLYSFFSEDMRSYDLIFVNNDQKSGIDEFLNVDNLFFLNQLISNLNTLGINYKMLSGTFEEKLLMSEKLIKKIKKRFS